MAIAIVVVLLVIGSVIFHFASPWYFTELASNWGMIDATVDITFWVTGIVFILVNLFMAYSIYKYRHKKGQKAEYEPENKKLEIWLTVITAIGVAAMLAPGLFVWGQFVRPPDNSAIVEAVGQQWHWSYRFPGEDGVMGTVNASLITPDNPFGMNPDDPNGQDDILVSNPEVYLPLNQPIRLNLRSKDVLHNFTVPQFRVKMDLVPGMVTFMWFEPTRLGSFDVLCEELCGIAHHAMRGKVTVVERPEFEAWLNAHPTYAETAARAAGNRDIGQGLYQACAACHGFAGEGRKELNAPKLAGQEGWYMARQIRNYKNKLRGVHPDDIYGQQMAAMAGTLVDDQAIANVIAYIETLPDEPAPVTVTGDADRGARTYETCAVCHGESGQGIWALNAPRLAGMSDWYLAVLLAHFRDGVRGAEPGDFYGAQMAQMAKRLSNEAVINDLVAYINTFPVNSPARVSQAQ
ncbi:MAG: cytochrome c oxidase subunit II [Gammaproteobacteria bacterium]|nr:cytochrome c oxidase subunit II [Gammaproteobacteria bacterium]